MNPHAKIVGIDVSSQMIRKGKIAFAKETPENVELIHTDLMEFCPKEQFDIVFSFATLYYVIPMERVKDKLKDWLKPEGVFCMGVDYFTENIRCHHWSSMLNIEMDMRSIGGWEHLFINDYNLKDVKQEMIEYANEQPGEVGTLFLTGISK